MTLGAAAQLLPSPCVVKPRWVLRPDCGILGECFGTVGVAALPAWLLPGSPAALCILPTAISDFTLGLPKLWRGHATNWA